MLHYETTFPVRYYETDCMGVVHHSNYIRYFECARNEMISSWGYPVEECDRDGIVFPVISVECRYKHPARMGDVLRVTAEIDEVPLVKLDISQAVYNQDGVLCAEGKVVLAFISKETGFPVRCPEKIEKIIESRLS